MSSSIQLSPSGARITDGKTVIDTVPEGPYLLVNAPPGTYSVSADYDDAINQQSVRIGGKPLRAVGECLEGATRFYDRVTSTLTCVEAVPGNPPASHRNKRKRAVSHPRANRDRLGCHRIGGAT